MAKREQTPLEILARDHNWRIGSLRRTLEIVKGMRHADNAQMASNAVLNEIQAEEQAYQAAKQELLQP